MTVAPLKQKFTKDEFTKYVNSLPTPLPWVPRGVTLHNTYMPNLAMVDKYLADKKWTEAQLIDNWWVSYIKMGWSAGPHIFVFRSGIFVATPLTMRGTHSPSFNRNYFGIEMLGDYSKEILPQEIRDYAVHAAAVLIRKCHVPVDNKSVVFHGEDPRTTHKFCPGKNVGPKWKFVNEISLARAVLK